MVDGDWEVREERILCVWRSGHRGVHAQYAQPPGSDVVWGAEEWA